ncbi:hypothetical protein L0665_09070 [Methanogenium marinum]|uniref:Dret-0059-like sensor domain-containing protein n=1 Tax=Methanogenium marinum TaxID=348610 RepID=A0A9Q4PXL1_9EURY|nr:hypothetical protein [Methanogenium marinum]MDE4908756.1 hypothetical protein [Methanogenium marinum]
MKADTGPITTIISIFIAAALISSVIFTAGCLHTEESPAPTCDDTAAHAEMQQILSTLQGDINTRLLILDTTAAETAGELSEMGLDASCACNYVPLSTLLYAAPSCKTVITVGRDGTVLTGLPASKTDMLIGKNLGNQTVIQELFSTRQALMSDLFPLAQGGYASVIEYPVFNEEEKLAGLVSLSFAPDVIIGEYAVPAVEDTPYTIMAAQTDGRVLYDADPEEIGKETFNESLYEDFPEILDFAHHYAGNWSGYDTYAFYDTGFGEVVQKEAYWTTIGIHGTEWRLIIIRET